MSRNGLMWLRRLPWWRGSKEDNSRRHAGSSSEQPAVTEKPARSGSMTGGITAAIRAGKIADARRRLARWRERYLAARRRAVELALSRLEGSETGDAEQEYLKRLLADTESAAVTETLVRLAHGGALSLEGMASFRECLAARARKSQLAGAGPEWRLNSKARGYRFVAELGVTYPRIEQRGVRAASLEPMAQVAIKPVNGAGSRGVFLVLADGRIYEPRGGQWLPDWDSLSSALHAATRGSRPLRDRWVVESLVTEDEAGMRPGRDLKFYCFYGRVGLVLEIDRWAGDRYCEWDRDGNPLLSGKYDEKSFSGDGATETQVELAEQLSAQIPAPFIRIDFLRSATGAEGMSFCEFTPRPGNFHRFGDEMDQRLGDCFLEASARLEQDLLAGKRFPTLFRAATKRKPGRERQ